VRRGLKLGFGIPLLLVGFFVTMGGIALTALFGPDGTVTISDITLAGGGHAILLDGILIRNNLPSGGGFSATLTLDVRSDADSIFVGVGPTDDVIAYLDGTAIDQVNEFNWPNDVRTEQVPGTGSPRPPGTQGFWSASDEGAGVRSVKWTVTRGDWSVVVMNSDATQDVDVSASASLRLPVVGPLGIALLVLGLVALGAGVLLTVSGARTPTTVAAGAPVIGVPAAPGSPPPGPSGEPPSGAPPPRPDAS
jgi:hypothetical protein